MNTVIVFTDIDSQYINNVISLNLTTERTGTIFKAIHQHTIKHTFSIEYNLHE